MAVMQGAPQERMHVPTVPHERMQERIVAQPADTVVPPVKEEVVDTVQTAMEMKIVKVFQFSPQERVQERVVRRGVSIPAPSNTGNRRRCFSSWPQGHIWQCGAQIKEELVEVLLLVPQERIQERR